MSLSLIIYPTIDREPTRCSRLAKHALHASAVAARLGSKQNVRELLAQRRHVLGDGGRGSILTASPFWYSSTIGVPAVTVDHSGSIAVRSAAAV